MSNWEHKEDRKTESGVEIHRYHKPVLVTGEWSMGEVDFEVDGNTLDSLKSTHEQLMDNKISVPLFLNPEHVNHENGDEDKFSNGDWNDIKKGEVKGYFTRETKDPEGKEAKELVAVVDVFGDKKKAAELTEKYDVSIYAPPSWKDSKKKEYKRPIRHLLLTGQPVMKGLGKFTPLAASFKFKGNDMTIDMKKLAKTLGIKEVTEESLSDAISVALSNKDSKLNALTEEVKTLKAKKKEDAPAPAPAPIPAVALSEPLINLSIENRESKIDSLLNCSEPKITPAKAKSLKEKYCNKENVTLALSDGGVDSFAEVFNVLKDNEPILRLGEHSAQQTLELADKMRSPEHNPLIANADKRIELAKLNNN